MSPHRTKPRSNSTSFQKRERTEEEKRAFHDKVETMLAQTDLREIVAKTLRPYGRGEAWKFKCPFHHEEKGAALAVYRNNYYCWSEACHAQGDAIDWMRYQYGLSFSLAVEALGSSLDRLSELKVVDHASVYKPTAVRPTLEALLERVQIPAQLVTQCARLGHDRAVSYFGQYGIRPETVARFMFGYNEPNELCRMPGYTIPSIWPRSDSTGTSKFVKAVKVRRDETRCDWSAKYLSYDTSETGGPFNMKWMSAPDGTWSGPAVPVLLMGEDEKTAALLDQEGYPAVGWKPNNDWEFYLPDMLARVGKIVILVDNDEDRIDDNGQIRNPGKEYAARLKAAIERATIKPVRMLVTPRNDLADVAKFDGVNAVHSWLAANVVGLEPVQRSF